MKWRKTYEGSEPQRVNKWLAAEGVCSRREAEALINAGAISIDGETVEDVGRKICSGQTLSLTATTARAHISAVLNKPPGYVSGQPEQRQIPAARLLSAQNLIGDASDIPTACTSLAPLGRLDQDSRGLLILSEDGVLAKALIGPQSKLDKEYRVRIVGGLDGRKLALLRHGLSLDGRRLKQAQVDVLEPQTLRFILREGRYRQIRRMCAAVGLEVSDLQRVRIGPLLLGNLPEGKWRPLTASERDQLIQAAT